MRVLLASVLLAVACPVLAQSGSETGILSPFDEAQMAQSIDRGIKLYRYDQSAWHVTDAMMEAVPAATKKLIRGYITTTDPGGYRTTFYGEDGDNRFKLYSAVWTGHVIVGAQIYSAGNMVPVSDEESRLILARKAATENLDGLMFCSDANPNAAAIPGTTPSDPVSVYIMTPQTKTDVFPLGGHNRVDVKDGKVVSKRAFTKGCIDFNRAELMKDAPKGATPVGMVVTHLLDPVPTEIHVFSVLAAQLPLYVGVSDGRLFAVEFVSRSARIRLLQGKQAESLQAQ